MAQAQHQQQQVQALRLNIIPGKWPEELYDYGKSEATHDDIESLDIKEGKWCKCKYCKNQKD